MEIETPTQSDPENAPEFRPIASQDELERVLSKRLDRERAKFADYGDLKDKAAKYDEAVAASKTELERERERATAAEARAQVAELGSLRARIAAEENVPVEVLHGDDEDAIRATAKRVRQWAESGRKATPPVTSLKSGSRGKPEQGSQAAAALRALRKG